MPLVTSSAIPKSIEQLKSAVNSRERLAAHQIIHRAGARLVEGDEADPLAIELPWENVDEEFVWAIKTLGLCGVPILKREYPLEMGTPAGSLS